MGTLTLLFFIQDIVALSILCNFTITIPGFVLAYIPLNMKKFEEITKDAKIKISRRTLIILVSIGMAYSSFLIVIMIIMEPIVVLFASIFYVVAICYYFYRKRWLKKQGLDIHEICKCVPDEILD